MKRKTHFRKTNRLPVVFGSLLVAAFTQLAGHAQAQSITVVVPPPVAVVPTVAADNYVYYPGYGVYFNSHRRQYYYMNGNRWITAPAPQGISIAALHATPFVNMNFHDSPAHHHAITLKQYPRNWRPDAGHPDRNEHPNGGHAVETKR